MGFLLQGLHKIIFWDVGKKIRVTPLSPSISKVYLGIMFIAMPFKGDPFQAATMSLRN